MSKLAHGINEQIHELELGIQSYHLSVLRDEQRRTKEKQCEKGCSRRTCRGQVRKSDLGKSRGEETRFAVGVAGCTGVRVEGPASLW